MRESPQPRNRLSSAHLMLWMLGTAIALGLYRLSVGEQRLDEMPTGWRVYAVLLALLAGPKLGGLGLWISRRFSGRPGFPTQPGHWLLAIEGMSTVLVYLSMAAGQWLELYAARAAFGLTQLPNCILTAVAYAIAYRAQPTVSQLWKTVLLILVAQHACAGLLNIIVFMGSFPLGMPLPTSCFSPLVLVFFVLAAALDAERSQRDYLHWAGTFTVPATEAIQWLLPSLIWWQMYAR